MKSTWGYVIVCPVDGIDESSLANSKDEAWEKFCYPALRREAYEAKGSGYKSKRVRVIIGNDGRMRRIVESESFAPFFKHLEGKSNEEISAIASLESEQVK